MNINYNRFLKEVDMDEEVKRNFSTNPNFKVYRSIIDNHDYTLDILKHNLNIVEKYVSCKDDRELDKSVITALYMSAFNIYALKEVLEKIQVSIYCYFENCRISNNKLDTKRKATIKKMESEYKDINITKLEDRQFNSRSFRNDIAHDGIYPFMSNLMKIDYTKYTDSTSYHFTVTTVEGQNKKNKEIIEKEFNKMLKDVDLLSVIANELKVVMINDSRWDNLFNYNER